MRPAEDRTISANFEKFAAVLGIYASGHVALLYVGDKSRYGAQESVLGAGRGRYSVMKAALESEVCHAGGYALLHGERL